jgi:TM2 domain-containing membrane protein YozV
LILILISSAWINCEAQTEALRLDDLRNLGRKLADTGDEFGAYIFTLSYYHLTTDSNAKMRSGFEALDICLRADRFVEAERLVDVMTADFADNEQLRNAITYKFGYGLALGQEPGRSNQYLSQVADEPDYRDRALFIKAYNYIAENSPDQAKSMLSLVELADFPHADTVTSILEMIDAGPSFIRRNKIAAVLMSMSVPGLGQAYSGHYFDAIQSLAFNFLVGGAAYLSWKYEVFDRESGDRNYALPVISTAAWSLFYLANIWNAANSASRYNRYHELQHYRSILDRFSIMRTDKEFFLNVAFPVN